MTRNTEAPTKPTEPRSDSTPYLDMGTNDDITLYATNWTPGPQTVEQYETSHESVFQRQARYERLFEQEYGKSIMDITPTERTSRQLLEAHHRAVARL